MSPSPPSAEEVLLRPAGAQLTVEYLEEKTFSVPILVARKEGLGMTVPPPSFTPRDVEQHVGEWGSPGGTGRVLRGSPHPGAGLDGPEGSAGAEKVVEVLDVGRQAECRMRLGDFVAYLGGARRDRVLSVTGLEVSDTR